MQQVIPCNAADYLQQEEQRTGTDMKLRFELPVGEKVPVYIP